jgi:hypothetical protein
MLPKVQREIAIAQIQQQGLLLDILAECITPFYIVFVWGIAILTLSVAVARAIAGWVQSPIANVWLSLAVWGEVAIAATLLVPVVGQTPDCLHRTAKSSTP